MELSLKKSISGKLEIGTNAQGEPIIFDIAYPTLKQYEEIERLKWLMVQDGKTDMALMIKYMRKVIACTVKAWQGMEEPIEVDSKGELAEHQLLRLTISDENTIGIYNLINAEIGFSETDKKK